MVQSFTYWILMSSSASQILFGISLKLKGPNQIVNHDLWRKNTNTAIQFQSIMYKCSLTNYRQSMPRIITYIWQYLIKSFAHKYVICCRMISEKKISYIFTMYPYQYLQCSHRKHLTKPLFKSNL